MTKKYVHDILWNPDISVENLVGRMDGVGFQSTRLKQSSDLMIKMKKSGAKIYFTFTSNMVTSGLRGLFAQLIKLGLVDVVVTTIGGIEEDIMKAIGEEFLIGNYYSDDVELYEDCKMNVLDTYPDAEMLFWNFQKDYEEETITYWLALKSKENKLI
mgnify:CR=1 FL=1